MNTEYLVVFAYKIPDNYKYSITLLVFINKIFTEYISSVEKKI